MKGTGLVVWAVWGPPVAGSMSISALPWSAVMSMDAAVLLDGLVDAAELGVDGFDGADGGLHLAGVADHVGVGEVDDDDVEGGVGEGLDDGVGDAGGGHLGGEIVGGDLLRGDELAVFAGEGFFDAAVEEVGDVGVLSRSRRRGGCADWRRP